MDTSYDEIRVCSHSIDILLDSIVKATQRGLCDCLKGKITFWSMHSVCISTPVLSLKKINVWVAIGRTTLKMFQQSKLYTRAYVDLLWALLISHMILAVRLDWGLSHPFCNYTWQKLLPFQGLWSKLRSESCRRLVWRLSFSCLLMSPRPQWFPSFLFPRTSSFSCVMPCTLLQISTLNFSRSQKWPQFPCLLVDCPTFMCPMFWNFSIMCYWSTMYLF